jgi:transcriptional regulator with XRE-family HTH domain
MASPRGNATQLKPKSLGGEKLRELRQVAELSLVELATRLEVEHRSLIDAGHINKIERGSIKKPLVETLEAILAGLSASYRDRRDVLELFGYTVPVMLPTDQEIDEVRRLTAYELRDATYPMYLIDVGQRLWAWNRYTPRLIGLHPDDPSTNRFLGVTIFDLAFNPALETRLLIDNSDEYVPAMLQFVKAGISAFREEHWYQELMGRLRTFPGFSALWDSFPENPLPRSAYRSIIPVRVRVPRVGVLQFRVSNTDFLLDPRFDIIHYTPFGATSLRACADWAEEEGVL